MKIYILFISVFILSIAGCEKLDLLPISNKSVEGFYNNETEINQALVACYSSAQSHFVNSSYSYRLTESRSDNGFQGPAYDDYKISIFTSDDAQPVFNEAWAGSYRMIFLCNKVLAVLPDVELDDAVANQFEGEAKFLRALINFDLVRFFGDIPLVTKELSVDESYIIERSSVADVYAQIESDLKDAATLLPASYLDDNAGRATKWAAKGFLGKVLVFQSGYPLNLNRWEEAKTVLEDVMSGPFTFFSSYEDIFKYVNENGAQSVFSIMFKSSSLGQGNAFPSRNAYNDILAAPIAEGGLPYGGSPHAIVVTEDLVNSFEPGDIRKDVAIRPEYLNVNSTLETDPFCQKYQDGPLGARFDWDINYILLRYTDVVMMYAECLNEIGYVADGEAFNILNDVRIRANLAPKTATDVPNQQSYRLWMEKERRHEFCFENQRWFDLVRTDRALEVMQGFLQLYGMQSNLKSRDQYIFPIPQRVLLENENIVQNPGY